MRMQTLWISIVGVLAVTIYAALAAVQILVLNPLAAAPGRSFDEIHAEMSNAGESLMPGQAFFILGVGITLAVALAVVAVCTAAHPLIPAMGFLVLLMLGAGGLLHRLVRRRHGTRRRLRHRRGRLLAMGTPPLCRECALRRRARRRRSHGRGTPALRSCDRLTSSLASGPAIVGSQ
jgi:hypothetical protein